MKTRFVAIVAAVAVAAGVGLAQARPEARAQRAENAPAPPHDAVTEVMTQGTLPGDRPEQQLSDHDKSDVFAEPNAPHESNALKNQPEQGMFQGFDFARDPLNAKRPMQPPEEIVQEDIANKPKVMALQKEVLERRYNLTPKLDPTAKMSRGKPLAVGPTARLAEGVTWESLADTSPDQIKEAGTFPYPPLPHPKHTPGGMVFPQMQVAMFPRLERFDVDFDLPEAFLPEFPPAIFLTTRPELGDVSRGQVVTINNFFELFKGIITPMEMDGLRLLVLPLPQEEFNATDDRKSLLPTQGVACFDCHVNGHTTGQIELDPQTRPQHRRRRLDTPSIRGDYNQQILGSQRSIRSTRDFAQFEENRAAYFNGDQMHADKKGATFLTNEMAVEMERFQNLLDWPPAPKLTVTGRLDPAQATESERRGEELFFGQAQCGTCHPAPFYLDNNMHNLRMERFTQEPGDGPIKAFTLRGIKDSPPYFHDGRCLTLEDSVELFNLVLGLKLSPQDKTDLVAFMRCL